MNINRKEIIYYSSVPFLIFNGTNGSNCDNAKSFVWVTEENTIIAIKRVFFHFFQNYCAIVGLVEVT